MAKAQVNLLKGLLKKGERYVFILSENSHLSTIADLSVGVQSQVPPPADRSTRREKRLEEIGQPRAKETPCIDVDQHYSVPNIHTGTINVPTSSRWTASLGSITAFEVLSALEVGAPSRFCP